MQLVAREDASEAARTSETCWQDKRSQQGARKHAGESDQIMHHDNPSWPPKEPWEPLTQTSVGETCVLP